MVSIIKNKRSPADLRMDQGGTSLICDHPFFSTILLGLKWVEDPTCCTMWVDGKRLGYNPDFAAQITFDECIGTLCEEALHIALLHPWRRQGRKPKKFNIACDSAIFAILEAAGFVVGPKEWHCKRCNKTHRLGGTAIPNKSEERIYEEMPDDDGGEGGAGICGVGSGGAAGGNKGDSSGDGSEPSFAGSRGDVRDARNDDGSTMSEAQREQAIEAAKVLAKRAYNAAKRAGKLPAGLEEVMDEVLRPKVPWTEILYRFIDGNARNDYSWRRPNPRYLQRGIIVPGIWSPGYGKVILALDASGSITFQILKTVAGALIECLEWYEEQGQSVEIPAMWFDTKVYPQIISSPDELLHPKGRGGTAYSPVFEYIREQGLTPQAVVVVTDGECSDFGTPPECPVLWILTELNKDFHPPFGEIAFVMDE